MASLPRHTRTMRVKKRQLITGTNTLRTNDNMQPLSLHSRANTISYKRKRSKENSVKPPLLE